jgi:hypothetical protein
VVVSVDTTADDNDLIRVDFRPGLTAPPASALLRWTGGAFTNDIDLGAATVDTTIQFQGGAVEYAAQQPGG